MKKKKSIETAVDVVNILKSSDINSHENEQDASTIKTIEASVRKIEKLKKEILVLKEKLRNKKVDFNQEKEIMWKLVKDAKIVLKSKPQEKDLSPKKGKKKKQEKDQKLEKVK